MQKDNINFLIFIGYSIITTMFVFFSVGFIFVTIESLVIIVYISSFLFSINTNYIITFSHNESNYKHNKFPKYGPFLSLKYWSRIEKDFIWIVIPTSILFFIFTLLFALIPIWYKTNKVFSNEFIFIIAFIFSLFTHIFFFIMTRVLKNSI
jgi:hypothetical protein